MVLPPATTFPVLSSTRATVTYLLAVWLARVIGFAVILVQLRDAEKQTELEARFPLLKEKQIIISSDAHYLWDIRDKQAYFELDDEPYSSEKIRQELFRKLRG